MDGPPKRNVILDWLFGAPAAGDERHAVPVAGTRQETGGFQPFGYRFEVGSPLPPARVKAALRSRMKGWFDASPGARGWIVGPFMCLWLSAFDRRGPMLLAAIGRGDLGTRVSGRAGSDLNGLAAYALLLPVLAFSLYMMMATGEDSLQTVIIVSAVLLFSPLVFWWSHKDRRQADPLVRFVEEAVARADVLGSEEAVARAEAAGSTESTELAASRTLILTTSGADHRIAATREEIREALLACGDGDFVILSAADEIYIQTAFADGGYVLERRDGDAQAHFQAVRSDDQSATTFALEEVEEAFLAWAEDTPAPDWLVWEPVCLF